MIHRRTDRAGVHEGSDEMASRSINVTRSWAFRAEGLFLVTEIPYDYSWSGPRPGWLACTGCVSGTTVSDLEACLAGSVYLPDAEPDPKEGCLGRTYRRIHANECGARSNFQRRCCVDCCCGYLPLLDEAVQGGSTGRVL